MEVNNIQTSKLHSFKSSEITSAKSLINENRMLDHFVRIAKMDTGSNPKLVGQKSPTTKGQLDLAYELAKDLDELGLVEINIDKYGFLTATLPSNTEDSPTIAFIAHLDTSSDVNTGGVQPIIHDYQDGDITLKDNQTIPAEELKNYRGHKIITSDGTSLLGADDKAGISEIIEALRVFSENPQLKHPTIKIAFTPDEETGSGIENFDIKKFNADVAYTVDGTQPQFIDTETFNAFNPIIKIKGVNTHAGHGYKKMINSIEIANEFINMLPENETASTTKDREGYFLVDEISGNVAQTQINMLVRDFDYEQAKKRVQVLRKKLEELKEKYPQIEYTIEPNEVYQNMKNHMAHNTNIIEYAKLGIKKTGLTPIETSVRGGTDGSQLTLMGLPCPNLGAGGENFHTTKEFVSLQSMKLCCENIINIAQAWAQKPNK